MDQFKRVFALAFCLLLILCIPYHASSLSKPSSPVIFIHGLASSAQAWLPIADFLRIGGWRFGGFPTFNAATGSVNSVLPGDFYTSNFSDYLDPFPSQNLSFARQGAELSAIIQAVLDANPGTKKVILVGHSMGGLAARVYLQGLAQMSDSSPSIRFRDDVVQLITIGTPNQGAEIAVFCAEYPTLCRIDPLKINAASIAVQSLHQDSKAFDATSQLGLNNLKDNPLPTNIKYISIIGTGQLTILREDGDGIVSVISQNLSLLAGTGGLAHESKSIPIVDRQDCGANIPFVFAETHTCEPGDPNVWTELLNQIFIYINTCHTFATGSTYTPLDCLDNNCG